MRTVDLDENIIPRKGLSKIKLGDNILLLRPFINSQAKDWAVQLPSSSGRNLEIPDFIEYSFKQSIYFSVNIYLGIITAIRFSNDFFGAFYRDFGVGSLVGDLIGEGKLNLQIKGSRLWVEEFDLTLIITNYDQPIDNLVDVGYCSIQSIIMQYPTYHQIPTSENLAKWKISPLGFKG
ncbi:MAG: hypothetical protein GY810_03560 [Aureispira sp.]|nr:hypothetical protein [Aureispira sp.]